MENRLTKKEMKEKRHQERKLEELRKMEEKSSSGNMKWLIIACASFLFLGFCAFSIFASRQKALKPVTFSEQANTRGNTSSHVTLTEFGDFQCPSCGGFEPVFEQLVKDYDKKIKIEFRHFPLSASQHPNAFEAATAAEAAGNQGKFWQYHSLLYAKQHDWDFLADPTDAFVKYAKSLKLDTDQFKKDLKSDDIKKRIQAQEDDGARNGVNSTPTVFINGVVQTNRNYDALKSQIEKALNSK